MRCSPGNAHQFLMHVARQFESAQHRLLRLMGIPAGALIVWLCAPATWSADRR